MGCFNQVCLLTRAPITHGDAIVVWEEIKGPWFRSVSEGSNHGLLFGLPQRAEYDDYGGAESYVNKSLFDLHEEAWSKQDLYRSHKVQSSYQSKTLYIASNPQTMSRWHDIEHLFYGQEELNPMDVFGDGYEEVFREKRSRATAKAREVLQTIGERLGKATLPKEEAACKAACFHIVQEEVGPHLAWPMWNIISQGELFARRELCMMRAEAFDYLVQTVSKNTASQSQVSNSKMAYRDWLSKEWDAWEIKQGEVTSKNPLVVQALLRNAQLMPMGRPWGLEEKPIEAFFWNTIGYDKLIQDVGRDAFLDAMVFTTAWHYLRTSLRAESGGGQHADWKLHADMMKTVYANVRQHRGAIKRDWGG